MESKVDLKMVKFRIKINILVRDNKKKKNTWACSVNHPTCTMYTSYPESAVESGIEETRVMYLYYFTVV